MRGKGEQRDGRHVFVASVYGDEGDETEVVFPGKHEVCARCEGHGTHLNPSIGQHAYTREEFDEAFSEDEQREAYFSRGGYYDVSCEECSGARVVTVVDEARCSPEQLTELETFREQERERLQAEAEDRRTQMQEDGICEW